jgi:hypothetical protein
MNETIKLSIVEMELAAMWAKMQSMAQTMVSSDTKEFAQMQAISDQVDKLRRQIGCKIEMAK